MIDPSFRLLFYRLCIQRDTEILAWINKFSRIFKIKYHPSPLRSSLINWRIRKTFLSYFFFSPSIFTEWNFYSVDFYHRGAVSALGYIRFMFLSNNIIPSLFRFYVSLFLSFSSAPLSSIAILFMSDFGPCLVPSKTDLPVGDALMRRLYYAITTSRRVKVIVKSGDRGFTSLSASRRSIPASLRSVSPPIGFSVPRCPASYGVRADLVLGSHSPGYFPGRPTRPRRSPRLQDVKALLGPGPLPLDTSWHQRYMPIPSADTSL